MSLEKVVHRHYFTYSSLLETIDYWNLANKITQNYSSWHFKHPLPELKTEWLCLIRHSLIYYLLKNFQWCFNDVQGNWIVLHSHSMKQAYSKILLTHCEDFDLKLLILIKTVAFFISKTIHEILIDIQLQNDIYQLIVNNLIGIPVQTQAYRSLLKIYKYTPYLKHERKSTFRNTQFWDIMIDCPNGSQTKTKNLQTATRRHAKRQTVDKLLIQVTHQMKSILKENLYVKPNVRASTPKYNIHELRQIENESFDERKIRHTMEQKQYRKDFNRHKQAIMSNQLSNAFEFNSNLKLKDVKTFPIQRSKPMLQPIRNSFQTKMKTTNEEKLQPKREESKHNLQRKNELKLTKNWSQIVNNMKNQLYTGKHKLENKRAKEAYNYDEDTDIIRFQSKQNNNTLQDSTNASKTENVKFRKLDLLNKLNVKILQQKMGDSEEEEVVPLISKNYSLFALKQQALFRKNFQQKKKSTKLKLRNSTLDLPNKE